MMEFALLASGSKGNSFVMRDGTAVIMIDCGTTKKHLFSSLAAAGVVREEIDALLITHDHSDHISQIRHFADLPVYSPVEIDGVETFRLRPLKPFVLETLKPVLYLRTGKKNLSTSPTPAMSTKTTCRF